MGKKKKKSASKMRGIAGMKARLAQKAKDLASGAAEKWAEAKDSGVIPGKMSRKDIETALKDTKATLKSTAAKLEVTEGKFAVKSTELNRQKTMERELTDKLNKTKTRLEKEKKTQALTERLLLLALRALRCYRAPGFRWRHAESLGDLQWR